MVKPRFAPPYSCQRVSHVYRDKATMVEPWLNHGQTMVEPMVKPWSSYGILGYQKYRIANLILHHVCNCIFCTVLCVDFPQ